MKKALKKLSKNFRQDDLSPSEVQSPKDSTSVKSMELKVRKKRESQQSESYSTCSGQDGHLEVFPRSAFPLSAASPDNRSDMADKSGETKDDKGHHANDHEKSSRYHVSIKNLGLSKTSELFKFVKKKSKDNSKCKNNDLSPPRPSTSESHRSGSLQSCRSSLTEGGRDRGALDAEVVAISTSATCDTERSAMKPRVNHDYAADEGSDNKAFGEDHSITSRQDEVVQRLDARLTDLDARFSEFTDVVQNEVVAMKEMINRLTEGLEMVQYQANDHFTEVDDNVNLCQAKIQSLQKQQAQQQAVLNLVDNYFGDIERKWGSVFLRSAIPTLVLILVIVNAVWKRIGNRYFMVPSFCLLAVWLLKRSLFE